MKSSVKLILIFSIIITTVYSCQKGDNTQLQPAFSAKLNGTEHFLKTRNATVNRGITIIAGSEVSSNERATMIITIRGAEKGKFIQEYDYITGVSVAEASCTYKIISKKALLNPDFYVSYEGKVIISDIDYIKKQISGSYYFDLKTIPNSHKKQKIEGDFVNLKFK